MFTQRGNNLNDDGGDEQRGEHAPQFLSGRVSLAALRERVEEEFIAETASRVDILADASSAAAQRGLVREVMDYVLAVEGISLSRSDRLAVLDIVYRDLFNFGPLETYVNDEAVTELSIDGPDRIHVRYHAAEPVPVDRYFDDVAHLTRILQRTLAAAGVQLAESEPFIEVGVLLAGRPARLTVAAPPASPRLHVEIRLHPRQASSLDACMNAGMLDRQAADLLRAILAGGHGLMIVGDAGAGKTTLLEALLPCLSEGSITVERAAELRLPVGIERVPPTPGQMPPTFADQIIAALERHPQWLVLDEVRFDESEAMWHALTADPATRCLWAFRGATNPLRLRTAFSMSVRRAQQGIDQQLINGALTARLPFVALLGRQGHQLKLLSIGEWLPDRGDALSLQTIWPAGAIKPVHALDWPTNQ